MLCKTEYKPVAKAKKEVMVAKAVTRSDFAVADSADGSLRLSINDLSEKYHINHNENTQVERTNMVGNTNILFATNLTKEEFPIFPNYSS